MVQLFKDVNQKLKQPAVDGRIFSILSLWSQHDSHMKRHVPRMMGAHDFSSPCFAVCGP